jgi:hypothetical protein
MQMFVAIKWTSRPLAPEQTNRMMDVWGKLEIEQAGDSNIERVCWFMNTDGSGGFTVSKVSDVDAAAAWELETALALGEFLELESHVVLDLDAAMPVIQAAVGRING